MPIDQTLMKGPFIKLDQWAFIYKTIKHQVNSETRFPFYA